MNRKSSTFAFHAVVSIVTSSIALAQGPSLYMDVGSLTFGFGVPSNTFAAAAPQPGVWNALDSDLAVGLQSYITPPLVDINGVTTGVTVEWATTGGGLLDFEFDEPNTTGDDQALMDDIGYELGPHEFRYRGLPAGQYDVYTYAMAPDSAAFESSVEVIGSFDPIQNVVGAFPNGYVLGVTHAFHTVNVTAGLDLVVLVDIASGNNSVNGIQVVPTGPSTGSIGNRYCSPAVVNSSGASAEISATGSLLVAANNLTVTCSSMPQNAFGFFILSQTQGLVPGAGGSQGTLCLSGAVGRYVGPGQIQNAGPMGTITLPIDLTAVPQPLGFVAIQAGETWNFQTWFRDSINGTPTSNFSDGVELPFF